MIKVIEQFVRFQIKYSRILILILIAIIGLSTYIATDLKIDPDFVQLIPKDSSYNSNQRILERAFEQNEALVILIREDRSSILTNKITNMSHPDVINYAEDISDSLVQSQYVVSRPFYEISDDETYMRMIVPIAEPNYVGSFKDVLMEINGLLVQVGSPPGIDTTVTGFPVLLDKIPTLLIEDSLRTIMITVVFIILILYWYSRNAWFVTTTVATPIVSLIFLAAFMVILGINVTITLAPIGVFILGLGADYGIHISTHYMKAREEHDTHRHALIHTIQMLRLPITASFLTTVAGFTALMFGVSPSSQGQGIVLALGIAIIYATSFMLFPVMMTLFYKKVDFKPNFVFQKVLDFLGNMASYQIRYSKTIIFAIVFITIIMIFGASKVQFSTSNSNWLPDTDPVSNSFREVSSVFGYSETVQIIVTSNKGDLRNIQTKKDIDKLISLLEGVPNIDSVVSVYDGLSDDYIEIYETLTNERKSQLNADYTLTVITLSTLNLEQGDDGRSKVLNDIREVVEHTPIYNADLSLYGNVVRFDELTDSLQNDVGVTTIVGLALVFFVASAVYASLVVGILALVPIIIAVIWTVGLMGFLGVPFTSLSTGIVSLVLGVGVDFSIHLVDGIKKFLARGKDIEVAIRNTLMTTGKAIFLSSLTTTIGFLSLVFANLLGIARLGYSLSLAIISVFIVSIVFVPTIMSMTNKKKVK